MIEFLAKYGYQVVFFAVLIEQLGVPLPSVLILLAAGALVGLGKLNVALVIGLTVLAALIGDNIWFEIGRRRGGRVLGFLCSISFEPDSCVRRTEDVFSKYGANSLLVSKFIPGFSTVAPPLAGMVGVARKRFLIFDFLGSVLWATTFVGLGFLFSDQFEQIESYAGRFGSWLAIGLTGAVLIYALWKFVYRQRFLRNLRTARINPQELKERLDAGEPFLIVDLRHQLDYDSNQRLIPTALWMPLEDLESRHEELPRDQEVVLYCTCPNEATSARVAIKLHRRGITRVRPLAGGLDAWRELGFPLDAAVQNPARPDKVFSKME